MSKVIPSVLNTQVWSTRITKIRFVVKQKAGGHCYGTWEMSSFLPVLILAIES